MRKYSAKKRAGRKHAAVRISTGKKRGRKRSHKRTMV